MSAPRERVLVTGGTGQTGTQVAKRLDELGFAVTVASRVAAAERGGAADARAGRVGGHDAARPPAVRLDWNDPSSHAAALAGVTRAYLVAPTAVLDPAPVMTAFIARALGAGVRRFVLLGSSAVPDSAPGLGAVERMLRSSAPGWAVLKPSWFMQNFLGATHLHARTLRDDGAVYTATGAGRVAFVDAADIAEVGVRALVDDPPANAALVITGPEALSYDDVARILGEARGRPVQHVAVSEAEAVRRLIADGIPAGYARLLVDLDVAIRGGAEDRVSDVVRRMTGRPPRRFADLVRGEVAVRGAPQPPAPLPA